MGKTTISWTDFSWNPVVGCQKVSAACDHCYAESWAKRAGTPELWNGQRRRTSVANWRQPFKWNRDAKADGVRRRVFCASLADVFDNQWEPQWRAEMWDVIADCMHLDWLLLTKRPQNIAKMLPPNWDMGWPHVWLGTTIENREEMKRRSPHLYAVPAHLYFWSVEPMLEDLGEIPALSMPDWLICGGESGPNARPLNPAWAASLRDQCKAAGVPFHFKQHAGLRPGSNGCVLDGQEYKEFPVSFAA